MTGRVRQKGYMLFYSATSTRLCMYFCSAPSSVCATHSSFLYRTLKDLTLFLWDRLSAVPTSSCPTSSLPIIMRLSWTGQSPSTVDGGAIGVKVLKRQEWDSLLLYSYILRKVESSRSESLGPTRIVDAGQDKHVSQRNAENEDIEPRGSGVDNASCFDCAWYTAGVSCKESTVKKTRLELKTQLPRRPSSAPARRQHPNMTTRGRRSSGRLQRVASSGLTNTVHRETTRSGGVGHAWYGAWQAEESAELHDGLVR